jgi:hypothetical protein
VAQVGHRLCAKGALGTLEHQLVITEGLKDLFYMLEMFRPGPAKYQNIIEEHKNKLVKEGPKNIIHQSLECRWCIGQAERHDQELDVAVIRAERRLGDVVRVHPHLVVAAAEVDLGEETRAAELIQ